MGLSNESRVITRNGSSRFVAMDKTLRGSPPTGGVLVAPAEREIRGSGRERERSR